MTSFRVHIIDDMSEGYIFGVPARLYEGDLLTKILPRTYSLTHDIQSPEVIEYIRSQWNRVLTPKDKLDTSIQHWNILVSVGKIYPTQPFQLWNSFTQIFTIPSLRNLQF